MLTLSMNKLTESLKETQAFSLPDMNKGTAYLYNGVYKRLSRGDDIKLSELDFSAFRADDVDSLRDLYINVFEHNYYVADGIASALRGLAPVSKAVSYV